LKSGKRKKGKMRKEKKKDRAKKKKIEVERESTCKRRKNEGTTGVFHRRGKTFNFKGRRVNLCLLDWRSGTTRKRFNTKYEP
jgi:hypothetical protein